MSIVSILEETKAARGPKQSMEILEREIDNGVLKNLLRLANDPYTPFNVVKIPKVTQRNVAGSETDRWEAFFSTAQRCADRLVTGNAAVDEMQAVFSRSEEDEEAWMRKVLKKHLNIGISTRSINKVFSRLIPVFEVQLAEKFKEKFVIDKAQIIVEPKLDGVRCIAIVNDGTVNMMARSGKSIVNVVDTIGKELSKLGNGVYDGEIMSSGFQSLMTQIHRKKSPDISDVRLALFDFMPLNDWLNEQPGPIYAERRQMLQERFDQERGSKFSWVDLVPWRLINPDEIREAHTMYVDQGFEGTMIKDPDATYKRGRGRAVLKLKDFLDADCEVIGIEEGTGRHAGRLGALIVDYNGVRVNVGSGFSDAERDLIFKDPVAYISRLAEVQFQEETDDGSLRFPVFISFRGDRE